MELKEEDVVFLIEKTGDQKYLGCMVVNVIFFACIWALYSTGAVVIIPLLLIVLVFGNFAILVGGV